MPERSVLLTCDDGLLNTLTDMVPVLEEEAFPVSFSCWVRRQRRTPKLVVRRSYLLFLPAPAGIFSFDGWDDRRTQRANAKEICMVELLKKLSQFDQPEREKFIETARVQFGLDEWDADRERRGAAASLRLA